MPTLEIAGVKVRRDATSLGAGSQGTVYAAKLKAAPDLPVVVKILQTQDEERTRFLRDLDLARKSTGFAAPILWDELPTGEIAYVAPLAEGVSIEDDIGRTLIGNLQICLEFASLVQILEEHGLAHGDIAPNNVLIAPDGTVTLIDLDGYVPLDGAAAPPVTIGHDIMLAPEQRDPATSAPTRESGYYQMALWMSTVIMGRFAGEGIAPDSIKLEDMLARGYWPEVDRPPEPGAVPIAALGSELQQLFNDGFSTWPGSRPGPDTWRRALIHALNNIWVHDCGEAFVLDPGQTTCPWCGEAFTVPSQDPVLKIQLLPNGPRYGVTIEEGKAIALGRDNLPGIDGTVSSRHLELITINGKILIRHCGRHPTWVQRQGQWVPFKDALLPVNDLRSPLHMRLAAAEIELKVV